MLKSFASSFTNGRRLASRVLFWGLNHARALRLPLLVAALAPLLTGCSNNPYPSGESAKNVSYKALSDDPKTFDPSVAYYVDESTVISNIYPSYYQYHYLKRDPFVLDLSLGEKEAKRESFSVTVKEKGKAVTKNGERWTFTIKKGLRFQDDPCFPGGKGREITAADFVFSFKRMADPALGSPIVSNLDDKVLGMAEFEKHQQDLEDKKQKPDFSFPVEGLQLDPSDPYTFRIVMNQQYPQLKYLMAMTFTTPIPHEAAEKYGEELARHPVGCGPFVMTEYTPKMRIVLERNPNYRVEYYPSEGAPGDKEAGLLVDAGKRLPFLDKIVFNIIRESVTSWNMFQQGYLDGAPVSQTNFQQVMASSNQLSPDMLKKGIRLYVDPGVNCWFFKFNMDDPVVGGLDLKHKKLRQALSTAVDWQQYIDLFRQGIGTLANYSIPPGVYGYDPNYKNPYRQFNLEKAKQLLAEAGYPNGIDPKTGGKFTLFYDNTGTDASGRQFNAFIIKQLEALGIHVESRPNRGPVWQDIVKKGQFQFIFGGWYADYPDPENFAFLLYGPNKTSGTQ